jgi:hypothetical protein
MSSEFKDEKEVRLDISYHPRPSGYGGSTGINLSFENMTEAQYSIMIKAVWNATMKFLDANLDVRWEDDTIL